uniref:Uncharacterized protein n=1 Tax=Plectus sambesii TaxID=2011161 RepID=A0A914WF03_9BILA
MELSLKAAILIIVELGFCHSANLVNNCHQCEKSTGLKMLITASGKCLDLGNTCTDSYFCLKTTTHMDKGGEHLKAHKMGCWNFTTVPGNINATAESGKCYTQNLTEIINGYSTYTEMCLCSDKDYCNTADRKSYAALSCLILAALSLLY